MTIYIYIFFFFSKPVLTKIKPKHTVAKINPIMTIKVALLIFDIHTGTVYIYILLHLLHTVYHLFL